MAYSSYLYGSDSGGRMTNTPANIGKNLGDIGFDFDKEIERNDIRIGKSFATFEDYVYNFDVSRLPDYKGMAMPYIGHIIFTRPSLNVLVRGKGRCSPDDDECANNYAALQRNSITAGWVNDKIGMELLHMLSSANQSAYMPIFTSRAMSYAVNDVSLKSIEKGHTFYGHFIKYGKHSEEHKQGGTMSIDFRNDYYHSIMTAAWIWMAYIMIVSKNDSVKPAEIYQKNAILDYAGSIYYIVTRADGCSIVYWEKLTGVFPKTDQTSIMTYNDTVWTEDKISIEFDYAVRSDPKDPNVLFDLNMLTAGRMSMAEGYMNHGVTNQERVNFDTMGARYRNYLQRPDSYEGIFGRGNAFAAGPVIKLETKRDGSAEYKLYWTKAGTNILGN